MHLSAAETAQLHVTADANGVELTLKVVPGASRMRIAGVLGSSLKIAVAAPAEGGKANAAVIEFLAGLFGMKRGDVELVSGHTRPQKRVRLLGQSADAVRARLRGL